MGKMNTTFRFIKAQTTSACYFTFSSSFGFERKHGRRGDTGDGK